MEATSDHQQFWSGIFRGFGGALLFSLPMLLTMEMWWVGFYGFRWRLIVFAVTMVPVLIGVAHYAGLRSGTSWWQDAVDGLTAYGIGMLTAAASLALLALLTPDMPAREIVGKLMVQAPIAAFGAIVARGQLGGGDGEKGRKQRASYWAELFFVAAGAFFVGSSVAATQEMALIPMRMGPWHGVVLLLVELALMHAFLYGMKFGGSPEVPRGTPAWSIALRYTLPGVVVSLAVSAYLLWVFQRFEAADPYWLVMFTVVLGFPCVIGGAVGRLIL